LTRLGNLDKYTSNILLDKKKNKRTYIFFLLEEKNSLKDRLIDIFGFSPFGFRKNKKIVVYSKKANAFAGTGFSLFV